ncbi:hypothetical protein LAWI1_G000555 [Lachnellula willkommii]|uniref:Uncharacterized protein n=1 Tax=Lachnellula willkommii TaxID=215461 RepID=A0A559MK83_9HELO|nr:hypothetical protein LAWI1_G000555 [Lachnellula willkommii]
MVPHSGIISSPDLMAVLFAEGDKNLWFNNFDDSTLIEQARPHFETVMQDNFLGWENSGAAVDYLWTGSESLPLTDNKLYVPARRN